MWSVDAEMGEPFDRFFGNRNVERPVLARDWRPTRLEGAAEPDGREWMGCDAGFPNVGWRSPASHQHFRCGSRAHRAGKGTGVCKKQRGALELSTPPSMCAGALSFRGCRRAPVRSPVLTLSPISENPDRVSFCGQLPPLPGVTCPKAGTRVRIPTGSRCDMAPADPNPIHPRAPCRNSPGGTLRTSGFRGTRRQRTLERRRESARKAGRQSRGRDPAMLGSPAVLAAAAHRTPHLQGGVTR